MCFLKSKVYLLKIIYIGFLKISSIQPLYVFCLGGNSFIFKVITVREGHVIAILFIVFVCLAVFFFFAPFSSLAVFFYVSLICFNDMIWFLSHFQCKSGCLFPSSYLGTFGALFFQINFLPLSLSLHLPGLLMCILAHLMMLFMFFRLYSLFYCCCIWPDNFK